MVTKFKVRGNVRVDYYKQGGVFVAHAPALDLFSCGSTFDEASKNIEEAMDILFDECNEKGTLQQVLANCGWESRLEKGMRVWYPPAVIGQREIAVAA